MARPGLTQHRKFLRLSRLLGSAPLALGCLELMWEQCYLNGDPYLGDAIDVEAAAQWSGETGVLCRALVDAGGEGRSGFIDELLDKPGHFECHDLFDHAPNFVGKRLTRDLERIERGRTLSELRAEAGRKGGKQTASKRQANGKQTLANNQQIATTPAPAPAPSTTESASALSCAEPEIAAPAPDSPTLLTLPCSGTGPQAWPVTEATLGRWREAYPALDCLQEARKMRLWLEENRARRKTYRGMGKFTLGWLERAQNGARGGARASPTAGPQRRTHDADQAFLNQLEDLEIPECERACP